ncbi:nicotinate-nucleotide adenylyltransferase [Luminiphilus sp.]|nr:nicotinate-nucleotide adenylyltransferase [Luminiphilus sp.]
MTDARALGLLGGAFDPVHIGHLRGAIAVREHLGLERVDLLPAAQSPLKESAEVTAAERLAMLEAAVQDVPGLGVDARELSREGPSYTVDTLIELRCEVGQEQPLIWIVGTDILPALPRWSRWQQLLELAHLVILERPGADSPPLAVTQWLDQHRIDQNALLTSPAGGVMTLDQPVLDIASSDIRALLAAGRDPRFLLPDVVMEYISLHKLFMRDTV